MGSQKRNLILGLLAITILGGAYAAISSSNKVKEEADKELNNKTLISNPSLNAKELTIITPQSEETFVKSGTDWVIVGKENIDLVQIAVDQLIAHAKTLEYTSIVSDNLADAKQYGFNPGNKIIIKGENGEEISLLVGDMTADKTGCYITLPQDKNIYLVNEDTAKSLSKSPFDLRNRLPEYVNYDNSKSIKIEKADGTVYTIEPNPSGALTEGYGEYILNGIYVNSKPILTEALRDNIGEPLYNIYAADFIDNPADLSVYGLSEPRLIISAEDNDGNTCVITVGNETDKGTTYAKFSNKPYVSTIDTNNINKIINAKPFDIIGKYFVTSNANEIDEITIVGKDTNAVFKIDHENDKVEYNGKEASTADFSEVFKQVSVLTKDGEVSGESGDEEARITILKSNGEAMTLRFLSYDENYYAVDYDGAVEFIIGKKAVELVLYAVSCVK